MILWVFLVGLYIVGIAAAFFVFPGLVENLISWSEKQRNLNYVVAERVLIGIILISAAGVTAYPLAIWWLGVLFIVAGVLLALFPAQSIQRILAFFLNRPDWQVRLLVLLVVALGAFILHSVMIL